MSKPKIYISGPITGNPDAGKSFSQIARMLRKHGWHVINPMTLRHNHDQTWESYMREDIKALMDCQAVYMLVDWEMSRGANMEHRIAVDLKMRVFYESQMPTPTIAKPMLAAAAVKL